jgi:hypothetical protein
MNSQREYAVESGTIAAARMAAPMIPMANSALAKEPARGSSALAASAADVMVRPRTWRVAAQVTTTKNPMTPVTPIR